MPLYKTVFNYVKTKDVVECPLAAKGMVTTKGEIRVDTDLQGDEAEFYITLLHEFIHLDRGDYLRQCGFMEFTREYDENEREVETLAVYLYHNNPCLVNLLRRKIMVREYQY